MVPVVGAAYAAFVKTAARGDPHMGNRQVVERWTKTLAEDDIDGRMDLLHPDYEGRYLQSGE